MFRKPFLISGLKRQAALLSELLEQMEQSPSASSGNQLFFYNRARLVASNLKKLRRLERNYRRHEAESPQDVWGGAAGPGLLQGMVEL